MPAALTPPPDEQELVGFLSNDQWDALLADVNARVQAVEAWPDAQARQQVLDLLDGVDAIHREALRRLVRLFKQGVLEQVVTDPAIRTLMELYDLLPQTAAAPVATAPVFRTIPIRAERDEPRARYPHWVPVLASSEELAPGSLRADLAIDGQPLLLARRDGEWFALDAACPVDGSPLQGATASGYTLSCPNHAGCHYDLRNGARIGGGAAIGCHPVRIDDEGRVLVGLDMDFKPSLPSF
jgi:nitrite reductase/ring-hydroxylating ferredoxin subunit